MTEHVGIVLPLYTEMTKRAIQNGKDVFAKFSHRDVEKGDTFYIYGSGENGARKIIAKARIKNADQHPASEVWDTYGDRLFQDKDEFDEYVRGRRSKEMLILELEKAKLLDSPVEPPGKITVAGLYLDKEMKEEIEEGLE